MNAIEFEITILRQANEHWPIVVRTRQLDGLTTHTEGSLQLTEDDWIKLRIEQENEKEYGKLLGQALFRDEVRDAFIRAYSKSSQNCRLRILLSIEVDNTDELRTLHWHRLCAPIDADGAWNLLVRDQRVPFSLYIPTIIDRRFSPIGRRDLRALVLVANPSNLDKYQLTRFNDKDVLNKVKLALGGIPCKFLANINNEDVIGPPTLEELSKQITDAPAAYTIIHIVCHGMLIKDGDRDTVLYWATKDNQVQTVRGTQLVQELKNIGERRGLPHLAFLCTCESAPPEAERALGGLGQQLVRHLGMPAVVAMTRKVSVTTALALGERFYQRLGEHGEVDLALQEATAGLGDRHDITVPALFSRLGGRPLFSDRLEGRELSEAEIEDGIEEFGKLIEERAPHASALKKEFEEQAKKLKYLRGSEIPSAKPQRQDALCKLNILCNQVLEISFEALAALGKKPPKYKAECPFPGLSSFKEEKYHKFFFGREELIKELHQKLKEDNFLAMLGPSGSGKSSVVLAGLIPKLQKEKPDLQMVYLRPGSEPLKQLQVSQAKASGQPTVFVVDQFEELFTLCSDESQRQGFIDQLLQLAQHQKVTMTMRSDFLGECTRYSALRERMEKRQKLVGAMEPTELGIAMKKQADAARLEFEEGLSNAILAEVEQEPGRMPLLQYALQQLWERRWGRWLCYEEYEEIGGVQKAIATTADAFYKGLSSNDEQERVKNIFVRLTRLDENAKQEKERRNTRRRVKLEELVPAGEDLNQIKKLVKHLADEGARLVVTSQDLATGKEEVEIAHEALIQHWSSLQDWLEKDKLNLQLREKITQAALEWNQHKGKEDYLSHRGELLERAERLLRQPRFLNQLETDYVNACAQLRDRRRRRTIQSLSGGLAAAFLLVGLAVWQWKLAEDARTATKLELEGVNALNKFESDQDLESLVLGMRAGRDLQAKVNKSRSIKDYPASSPLLALQTILDKIHEQNRIKASQNPVLWKFIQEKVILRKNRAQFATGHGDSTIIYNPDGKHFITFGKNGTVRFWKFPKQPITSPLKVRNNFDIADFDDSVPQIWLSFNGQIIGIRSEQGNVVDFWDVNGNKRGTFTSRQNFSIRKVAFSHDSKQIAVLEELDGGEAIQSLHFLKSITYDVVHVAESVPGYHGKEMRFSRDGQRLFTGDLSKDYKDNNYIKIWNPKPGFQLIPISKMPKEVEVFSSEEEQYLYPNWVDGKVKLKKGDKEIAQLEGNQDWFEQAIISPDKQRIATLGKDGKVRFWNLSGKYLRDLNFPQIGVRKIIFSPNSQYLATVGEQGLLLNQVLSEQKQIMRIQGSSGWFSSISFSPDGQRIIAGSQTERTVRMWDLAGRKLGELKITDPRVYSKIEGEIGTGDGFIINVGFTPNGKDVVVTSRSKPILIWKVEGLNDLLVRGCNWLQDYLKNPNIGESNKSLCDGIDTSGK